jgi:EpsI family protein
VAVSGGLLIAALLVLQLRPTGEAVPLRKPLDTFPAVLGEWQGREATVFELDVLNLLKVNDYLMRRYVDASGRSLWLYIAYWETQRKASLHSPKNCLPGAGWEPIKASLLTIALPPPYPPITVNSYLLKKERDELLVFYWYDAQGRAVAGEVAARVELIRNSILRNRSDGALIRISSAIYGSVPETSASLTAYIQAMYPLLAEYLPE